MAKRLFDIFFSIFCLVLISPVLLLCFAILKFTSREPVIYKQVRVGKDNIDFILLKFRTMYNHMPKTSLITIGKDPRITPAGHFMRKYKLDEFPQLINVLKGDMSIVGPRPELRAYVDKYTTAQLQVLNVKPGMTDYASIMFHNESEILGKSEDPEKEYLNRIMPEKLSLNLKYIEDMNFLTDIKIILKTVFTLISIKHPDSLNTK